MDFGLNGQLIPDIVYGYVRNVHNPKMYVFPGFITTHQYNLSIEEDKQQRWHQVTKRSSLSMITTALFSCAEIYRYAASMEINEMDKILKQLFDLEEWKTCQCIPTSAQNVITP